MDREAILRAIHAQLLRELQYKPVLVVNRAITPVSKNNQLEGF